LFRHLLLQIGGANIENPPPSSSLAEETTPPLAPPPCGGARFSRLAAGPTALAEGLLKDRPRHPGLAPPLTKTGTMKELTKIIVAGVSTVALAGGIGAGLAFADTPTEEPTSNPIATATTSPTAAPVADPSDVPDQNGFRNRFVRQHLRFLGRALHGEVTLAGEKHQVIAFQRGNVQKISRTSLTVRSNDGFVETYVLSTDTNVREKGDKSTLSEIAASDRVMVVATKNDSTLTARRVIIRDE
jgi:hypothetical protein